MATDNLLGKLKRDFSTALTVGALVGTVYGCGEDGNGITDPPPPQNHTPQIILDVSPLSGVAPLNVRIQYSCTDADGANDIAQSRLDVGSYTSGTTSLDSTFTFSNPGTYPARAYCKDKAGEEASAGPIDVVVSPLPVNNPPQTTLAVNPTSGVAPLEVRVQYACTDPDGANDIAQSRLDVGSYTSGTTSLDSTFTFTNPGTYATSGYCKDKAGEESTVGPIDVVVSPPSPPTDRIAFWSNRTPPEGGYNEEIYSMNIDGTGLQRLTTDPGQDLEPTWSPDGTELLFTSHRTGGTAVWRMYENGSGQRDISSNLVERARQADWCSDGKIVVAYRDNGDTEAGIGIISSDGTSFTPIYTQSNIGGTPEWPSCSPDASEIAFGRSVSGNWEVYKMNADGSGLINLTNHSAVDGSPDWSPLGDEIIFKSYRGNGSADIYVMKSDGSNVRRLTNDPKVETDPDWSYDGSKIVFTHFHTTEGNLQLYIMNPDGTNWNQITFVGDNRYPAWKP